jgi:hypothetical protein
MRTRREHQVNIRIGTTAYEALRQRAAELGLSFSKYARQMLFVEMPHVETYDETVKLVDAAINARLDRPDVAVKLLHEAFEITSQAYTELVTQERTRRERLDAGYQRAKAVLEERQSYLESFIRMLENGFKTLEEIEKERRRDDG